MNSIIIMSMLSQVIAVGGDAEDRFIPRFLEMAGGPAGHIFVVAAARTEKERQLQTLEAYRTSLIELGVPKEHVYTPLIVCREGIDREDNLKLLGKSTGIILSAGNQNVFMERLKGTKLLQLLKDKVQAGTALYTISAGTAALGSVMITGDDGMGEGIGIFKNLIFESHYSHRKREERLKRALAKHPEMVGVGIDEHAALIVTPKKREIMGDAGTVYIIGEAEWK